MARRGIPKEPPVWYLRDWMKACGNMKQADMMRETGWSKATMSQLYNDKQDINSKVLREAAQALKIEPHELLMPPEQAMALRRLRSDALRIVEDSRPLEDKPGTGTHG